MEIKTVLILFSTLVLTYVVYKSIPFFKSILELITVSEKRKEKRLRDMGVSRNEQRRVSLNVWDGWSELYFSPEFRKKLDHMNTSELIDYARSSPERRKKVRDIVERNYEWRKVNSPRSWIQRSYEKSVAKQIAKGEDPFDQYYGNPKQSACLALVPIITIVLQLVVWSGVVSDIPRFTDSLVVDSIIVFVSILLLGLSPAIICLMTSGETKSLEVSSLHTNEESENRVVDHSPNDVRENP